MRTWINPAPQMSRKPRRLYDTFKALLRKRWHWGVDIKAPYDSPLVATSGGLGHKSGFLNAGAGYGVELWHPDFEGALIGYISRAIHMDRGDPMIAVGEVVEQGQQIGVIGASGITRYEHVHFEIRRVIGYRPEVYGVNQGTPLDPIKLGILEAKPVGHAFQNVVLVLPILEQVSAPYAKDPWVQMLQDRLNARGLIKRTKTNWDKVTKEWDGALGPDTANGIRRAQRLANLNVTGICDADLWDWLFDL